MSVADIKDQCNFKATTKLETQLAFRRYQKLTYTLYLVYDVCPGCSDQWCY